MPLADLLTRLAGAFPVHEFDPESARASALRRLAALQRLPIPVPEEVLAAYRDASPVEVVLADRAGADEAVLDFTIWPERDGSVLGVQVCFATEEDQRVGSVLLVRLASILGWESEDVSDEVA